MTKQEVIKKLRKYDITKTELEQLYKRVVKEAKILWREGCIQEERSNFGMPRLYAQIGFNPRKGLMGRVDWHYSYMNGEVEEWYHALQISVLDEGDYTAANAADYLYESKYYQRTGQIPKTELQGAYKNYPLSIKSFEEVVFELAERLK